jgi:hypothetical protein
VRGFVQKVLIGYCVLSAATAAPLPDLPAAANWAIHLDADRLRKTPQGKTVLAQLEQGAAANDLLALNALSRFGLGNKLQSMTLLGVNDSGTHALAYAKGRFNQKAVLATMQSQSGYKALGYKGHTVHRWKAAFNGVSKNVYGTFTGKDALWITLSDKMIKTSIEELILSPKTALSSTPLVLPALSGSTFLCGVARPTAFSLGRFGGGAFNQVDEARLTLGLKEDHVAGALTIDAGSPETALQLKTVAQGMIVVAKLGRQKNPHLADFAQSLVVTTQRQQVNIATSALISDLLAWWRHAK